VISGALRAHLDDVGCQFEMKRTMSVFLSSITGSLYLAFHFFKTKPSQGIFFPRIESTRL
jgi:hypothetical protein